MKKIGAIVLLILSMKMYAPMDSAEGGLFSFSGSSNRRSRSCNSSTPAASSYSSTPVTNSSEKMKKNDEEVNATEVKQDPDKVITNIYWLKLLYLNSSCCCFKSFVMLAPLAVGIASAVQGDSSPLLIGTSIGVPLASYLLDISVYGLALSMIGMGGRADDPSNYTDY